MVRDRDIHYDPPVRVLPIKAHLTLQQSIITHNRYGVFEDDEMRIATWCIDGIRGRLEVLRHWLQRRQADVVALQKIRASEEQFPTDELLGAGYRSETLRRGSKYGVAVLIREEGPSLEVLERGLAGGDGRDDGLLTVRVGDLLVCCVYAPYGNPRKRGIDGALAHKIAWLDRLHTHLEERCTASEPSLLCGDFNVLPDVPAKQGILNCTSEEKKRFQRLLNAGFVDLHKRVNPASDHGLNYDFNPRQPPTTRLQLLLGSASVAKSVISVWVDLEYRSPIDELVGRTWPASAPVIADLMDPA